MKRLISLVAASAALAGCADMSNTRRDALIGSGGGALVGALAGQALGHNTKGTLIGAAVGATVGGISGGLVGSYMDKQEAAMRDQMAASQAVTIKRNQNNLDVNFKSDLLFDVDSSRVSERAATDLANFAKVVNDYPETLLVIAGHTDSTGTNEHNQRLSERRAEEVRAILVQNGVSGNRISTHGYGESHPVADNKTEGGRARNRRVDITIKPVVKEPVAKVE